MQGQESSFLNLLQVNSFEQNACAFLKEVVKANKMLQRVQKAAEGIKGNVAVQVITKKLDRLANWSRFFVNSS